MSRRQIGGEPANLGFKSFNKIRKSFDSTQKLPEVNNESKPVNVLMMPIDLNQLENSRSIQKMESASKHDKDPNTIQEDVQGEHGGDDVSD